MKYSSESAKVRDMPHVMKYVTGDVADIGAGHDPITPAAYAVDGKPLPGITETIDGLILPPWCREFDSIFSSHFLEHTANPYDYVNNWWYHLKPGGHLVLYLPEKTAYNNFENPEHLHNWSYDDFMFWFKRSFCGEGKNYRGENLPKRFELVDHALDLGEDRYSFYVISRRV